jgi:hypothetical protein
MAGTLLGQTLPREIGAPIRQYSATRAPNGSDAESVVFESGLGAALLRVPLGASARIENWPVAPSTRANVLVTRHDVYAADARILRTGGGQQIEVPRSRLVFLWGNSETDANSRVLLWVDPDNGEVEGWTNGPQGVFSLSPPRGADRAQLIVSEDAMRGSSTPGPAWSCGGNEAVWALQPSRASERQQAASTTQPAITSLHTMTVAIDTDNELLAQKFSENTTAATNYLAQLFAATNVIYERDLLIRLLQGQTYLRTASLGADPWNVNSGSNANGAELDEFGNYWFANYGGINRGLAAMLSGKQPSASSSSGIAWIDALCEKGIPQGQNSLYGGYSFTKVFKFNGSTGASDALVWGHELGHNFGSPHTHCVPPGQSTVIDTCYAGESSNTFFGCYGGVTSCPAPATYQGVPNVTGTLMSYCHLSGIQGCTASQVYHPRTIQLLQPLVQNQVNVCIFPAGSTLPTLSVNDVSVTEGNSGTTNLAFTVTQSATSTSAVTVAYTTTAGTASAGPDYTTASGTLTIAAGATTGTITIGVVGDVLDEANETFTVTLSSPNGATLADATGIGTINDDDDGPTVSITGVTLAEGNSGSASATFNASLTAPSGQTVTVAYTTGNGTATSGSDYTPQAGTLTFSPLTTTQPITVPVLGDRIFEANETFTVTLSSPSNATLGTAVGTGTINNDDAQGFSVNDATGREGFTNVVFTVTLAPAVAAQTTVAYATANGTATVSSDYTAASGTLTFAANETTKTVSVTVGARDLTPEAPETFTINLSNATGAAIGSPQGTGIITDSPRAPGDLGGDYKTDIVWRKVGAGVDKGAVFLWTMNGTGLGGARYLDPISEDWQVQFTGDFNGDGKTDILWRNFNASTADAGKLYIWMMDGANVIGGTGYTASQADLGWRVDGVGDLNGDGKDDIVWRKTGAGVDKGAVFLWTMNGTGLAGARYLDPISEDWQVVDIGDFNGDGKGDILWRNMNPASPDAGKLYIWMMDGANVIGGTGYTASQADLGWRVDGVGDLNGDGKDDIVWRKVGAGVDKGAVFLWTMNGTGLAGARYLDPIGEDWQVQALGDFNGDGKGDILWRNQGPGVDTGNLYIWIMDGANVVGGTGYTAAQADLGWRVDSPRK